MVRKTRIIDNGDYGLLTFNALAQLAGRLSAKLAEATLRQVAERGLAEGSACRMLGHNDQAPAIKADSSTS